MQIVLISLYDMGRQPFGLASPAAWLRQDGAVVSCQDLSVQQLNEDQVRVADLVGIHLPMHTATRIATRIIERVRRINPQVHICCYGLYAPLNDPYLRKLGADSIIGGEFEAELVALQAKLQSGEPPRLSSSVSLQKLRFLVPDRQELPDLSAYAHLDLGDDVQRSVGYTEASRGCKHQCRHCPIVPVYEGNFRVVQREVVMEDIRQQVTAGAKHVTFGDPDFFNGPGHALAIVRSLHAEFPSLTYDVTIKVEHLLKHREHLHLLRQTGCLFITSAIESVDDRVLQKLEKGHTRADFLAAVAACRQAKIVVNPTFVAFHPWLTLQDYLHLLSTVVQLELVDYVAPIQYAIRLLIPAGSKLLALDDVQRLVQPFDEDALVYPWAHPDSQVDWLQQEVLALVKNGESAGKSRRRLFFEIWSLTRSLLKPPDADHSVPGSFFWQAAGSKVPKLSENWYC